MSNDHHPLSNCVIYILVSSIIILLSNSVGSNRVYVTADSDTIKGSFTYATSSFFNSNIKMGTGERWHYRTDGGINLIGPNPSLKSPQLDNLMETRTTIPYNICHYADEDGRQVLENCWWNPARFDIIWSDGSLNEKIPPTLVYLDLLQQSEFHYPSAMSPAYSLTFATLIEVIQSTSMYENAAANSASSKQSTFGAAGSPQTSTVEDDDRVVGGTEAVKNSWPGIGLLRLDGQFRCGVTLISPTKVLTAAHCVYGLWPWDIIRLTVELGIHVWTPDSDAQVVKKVKSAAGHPLFLPDINVANDVAVLTLDSPVTYTSTISPVSLPPDGSNDQYAGQSAIIVGWGRMSEGGSLSPTLQQATIKVISKAQCAKSYLLFFLRGLAIKSSMLCATSADIGSCNGDSGGPLFVRSTSSSSPWIQAGIVSFGLGCASAKYPSVYTRVSSFLPWIKKHMGKP